MKLRSGTVYTFNSQSNKYIKKYDIPRDNTYSCFEILFTIFFIIQWCIILSSHYEKIYYNVEKNIDYITNYSYQLVKYIDINSLIENYTNFDDFEYDFDNHNLTFM
jgi:hypothetical protein